MSKRSIIQRIFSGVNFMLILPAALHARLAAMSPLEKALLGLIAQGRPPLGKETLAALPASDGANPTIAKVRVAIERLRRSGLLDKSAHGGYYIEDSLFEDYVKTLPLGTPRKVETKK